MEINDIYKEVDIEDIIRGYIIRDGFVFVSITHPGGIYDTIVIKHPTDTPCSCPKQVGSKKSLQAHVDLINKYKLEKAFIIAEDIEFIQECPSLKYIKIVPSDNAGNNFDYSPLYNMPQIKWLSCPTVYGERFKLSTSIDYSRINGIESIGVSGKGYYNYNQLQTVKSLGISGYKESDLTNMFSSPVLDDLMIIQCGIKTLDGLQRAKNMQCMFLYYNRSLKDISALRTVKHSIRALEIENCPKIEDFSVLGELENLEYLKLWGGNSLPSLDFIKSMKNLKTFEFTMNVLDGDLTPCKNLSYARTLRDRRHYNLKDKDLPKGPVIYGQDDIDLWRRRY